MIFTIFNTADSYRYDELYIGKYDWNNDERKYIDFIKDNFKIVELEEIKNKKNPFENVNFIKNYIVYKVKIEIDNLDELLKLNNICSEIIISKKAKDYFIEIYDDYRE